MKEIFFFRKDILINELILYEQLIGKSDNFTQISIKLIESYLTNVMAKINCQKGLLFLDNLIYST